MGFIIEQHLSKIIILIIAFFTIRSLMKVNKTTCDLNKTASKMQTTATNLSNTTLHCDEMTEELMEEFQKTYTQELEMESKKKLELNLELTHRKKVRAFNG